MGKSSQRAGLKKKRGGAQPGGLGGAEAFPHLQRYWLLAKQKL